MRRNRRQGKNTERQTERPENKGCWIPVPKTQKAVSGKDRAWVSGKRRTD